MAENDLADNLQWCSGTGCESRGVPSQIMRPQIDIAQLTSLITIILAAE